MQICKNVLLNEEIILNPITNSIGLYSLHDFKQSIKGITKSVLKEAVNDPSKNADTQKVYDSISVPGMPIYFFRRFKFDALDLPYFIQQEVKDRCKIINYKDYAEDVLLYGFDFAFKKRLTDYEEIHKKYKKH